MSDDTIQSDSDARQEPRVIAIIGAGMAGLTAARALAASGRRVVVFDKGRAPGGRMSTRRDDGWSFDHGAQYFTVRDGRFQRAVEAWRRVGAIDVWCARLVELARGRMRAKTDQPDRYVGVPSMSALCAQLAHGLDVRTHTEVGAIERANDGWSIADTEGASLGTFDAVIVSAPAAQSARLLAKAPHVADQVVEARMLPCWSLMLAFEGSLDVPFDAAFIKASTIAWVARNTSKPHRGTDADGETWIVHATPEWSKAHLEQEAEFIADALFEELGSQLGMALRAPVVRAAHRWRFARTQEPIDVPFIWDSELRIGACGDWCLGSRVESAYLSGLAVGRYVAGGHSGDSS